MQFINKKDDQRMIDLLEYFKENYKQNDYYKNYYFSIKDIEDIRNKKYFYRYYDTQEIIEAFRDIIKPENEKNITIELDEKFILICFYLTDQGFVIKEFPELLKRPKSFTDSDLYDFMYRQIRTYIINHNEKHDGTVTWDERRNLISSLNFIKSIYPISVKMDELVKEITNEKKYFNELNENSKLETICNAIEYLLKDNNKFNGFDSNKCFNLLSNENISNLRKILQCYRHSTKEDIKKREDFTQNQKDFLIKYGIIVIESILDIQ